MTIEKAYLDAWQLRVKSDLAQRMSKYDPKWKQNYALVRNSDTDGQKGSRNGNLVAEFVRMLHSRLLASSPEITIDADDPDFRDQAENASIVAHSVTRVAKMRETLQDALTCATWASHGWIEAGHPMDQYSLDVMRKMNSPNTEGRAEVGDSFEEVDQRELDMRGIPAEEIDPFTPLESFPDGGGAEDPKPIFSPLFGYPWLASVDPRYYVTDINAKNRDDMDYICRFRFLTVKELKAVSGHDFTGRASVNSEYIGLFTDVEGKNIRHFPDMLMVAELWIIRDRNNPEYNNYYVSFVFNDTDHIIHCVKAPYGGMIPPTPIKLSKLKKMYDTTLAEELAPYADMFHKGTSAMSRSITRMLNRKWGVPKSAGMEDTEQKKMSDDNYQGVISINDPTAIQQIMQEKFDGDLVTALNWVKGQAQSTSGSSDIDRGQAVKDITARQTQALLEATGINVDSMKDPIDEAAVQVTLKVMHLVAMFNNTRPRKYQYGSQMVSMDVGTHDFTSSFVYDVKLRDSDAQVSNEDRLVYVQFLRLVTGETGQQLLSFLNMQEIARQLVRKFSLSPKTLNTRSGIPQEDPALLAEKQKLAGIMPPGNGMMDAGAGQHPERQMGDRGINLSNSLVGALNTGSGTGES